jgi:hypothetical protein
MSVKDMLDEELKKEWEDLNYIVDSKFHGLQDIVRLNLVSQELENRGYKIKIITIRSLVKE